MEERFELAIRLARQAGTIIKSGFGKQHNIQTKQDNSPVTGVDRQINQLVVQEIRSLFPDDGVLGEEGALGDGREYYQWICDPLDGTKPFILGIPFSVFMIGLSHKGKMLFSVVYNPYEDLLYHALRGKGAYCNGAAIRVNDNKAADGYVLIGADSFQFVAGLKAAAKGVEPVPGTGYKFIMIATGRGIGMVNDFADFYDVGPGSLLVEEAGGRVTDLSGAPLVHGRRMDNGVIVSNGLAHHDLLEIAAQSN